MRSTAARWAGSSSTGSAGAPIGAERGRRTTWRSPSWTSPRRSSRRSASRPTPASASSPAPTSRPREAISSSSARRCTTPRLPEPASAAAAGSVAVATISVRARVWPRTPVVPGGSTSSSPLAGVEQYSRATQSPSSTSSRATPASSAASGSARRAAGSSLRSASSTTTPSRRWRPNGTSSTVPTPTSPRRSGSR